MSGKVSSVVNANHTSRVVTPSVGFFKEKCLKNEIYNGKMCVVITPDHHDQTQVKFVSPYKYSCYTFDQVLSDRSAFLPVGYVFSVRVYEGQYLHVTDRCQAGSCSCIYYLDYIPSLLKPCRFAALLAQYKLFSEADKSVLTGVCQGFRIIDQELNLSYSQKNYKSILVGNMYEQMCNTISKEVKSGQISQVSQPATCVHALGAVVRPDGRLRPITDCSRPSVSINDHMMETAGKFTFSHIEDTRQMISPLGYGGVVDISNAYRSVLIYPPHRTYVGFQWEDGGKLFHFVDNALCFGLKSAPAIFNSLSDLVVRFMKAAGIPCLGYLDDYFVSGESYDSCEFNQVSLMNLLTYLGFVINTKKVVTPSRKPKYLGVIIDLEKLVYRLPQDKLDKTLAKVSEMLNSSWCSRKSLERVTGLLAHCSVLVRGGRTFCRRLYSLLKATIGKRRVRLGEVFRQDLLWWKSFLNVFDGTCPIFPPLLPTKHFFTDASGTGFGAWHLNDFIFGFWGSHNYDCEHVSPPPVFNDLTTSNINVKELWPVVASINRWGSAWTDCCVLLNSDNTQVVSMIISGRSKNHQAMCLLRELFWSCSVFRIDLRARYVSTNDNIFADKLSRLPTCKHTKVNYGMPLMFNYCCSQNPSRT